MFCLRILSFAVVCCIPKLALAQCAPFSAYGSDGSYHADIEKRIEAILSCPVWPLELKLSNLNHAQGFVIESRLEDNKFDEAISIGQQYFRDAVRRYEISGQEPEHLDILKPEGRTHTRLGSNLYQVGMLLFDAQSTRTGCSNRKIADVLMSFVELDVRKAVERSEMIAERARKNLESDIETYSLEEWKEYYPNISTKEELRALEDFQRVLNPSSDQVAIRKEIAAQKEIDREFISLFTTTVRVKNGQADDCLKEVFFSFPPVAALEPDMQQARFPRTVGLIQSRNAQ